MILGEKKKRANPQDLGTEWNGTEQDRNSLISEGHGEERKPRIPEKDAAGREGNRFGRPVTENEFGLGRETFRAKGAERGEMVRGIPSHLAGVCM